MTDGWISDNEAFVDIVRAAQGDPKFRKQLLDIISLDHTMRKPAVRTLAEQLQIQKKPPDFIAAVIALADDKIGNKVREVVEEFAEEDTALTQGVFYQLTFAGKALLSIIAGAALAPSIFGITSTMLWVNFAEYRGGFDFGILAALGLFTGAWVGGIVIAMCSRMFVMWFALLSTIMLTWNLYLYDAYGVRYPEIKGTVLSIKDPPPSVPEASAEGDRARIVTYRVDNVRKGRLNHRELKLIYVPGKHMAGPLAIGTVMRLKLAETRDGFFSLVSTE